MRLRAHPRSPPRSRSCWSIPRSRRRRTRPRAAHRRRPRRRRGLGRRARHAAPPSPPCATAATPSTPRSPPPACSAWSSPTRAASAAAASWSSARATARSPRSTRASCRRPRCARDSFFENGAALDFDDARYSGLSVGVPGTVAGWERALRRYGTRSLSQVLRPASAWPGTASSSTRPSSRQTEDNVPWFDDVPSDRAPLPRRGRHPARPGRPCCATPTWPRTYRRIARGGADAFYSGPIADAIVDAARRPPIGAGRRPRLAPRAADRGATSLAYTRAGARAHPRAPTAASTSGAWDRRRAAARRSARRSTSSRAIPDLASDRTRALHLFLEASRFSFADRNAFVADPGFFDVPLGGLLSDGYAAERRALIDERTRPRARSPTGASPTPARPPTSSSPTATAPSSPTRSRSSRPAATASSCPGYGFLLNNELTDFNIDAARPPEQRRPAASGRAARWRRRSSRATAGRSWRSARPAARRSSRPSCRCCSSASTWARTLPEAIARPRASQRNAATTEAEPAFIASPEGAALDRSFGHEYEPAEELGAVTALELLRGGRVLAAAEPVRRGGGSAAVVRALEFRGVRPQTRRALALGCLAHDRGGRLRAAPAQAALDPDRPLRPPGPPGHGRAGRAERHRAATRALDARFPGRRAAPRPGPPAAGAARRSIRRRTTRGR